MTSIFVTGDYRLDHHLYEGKRSKFADRLHRGVHQKTEMGGAALVHYLLQELQGGVESHLSVEIDDDRTPKFAPKTALADAVSAYAVWKPFDSGDGAQVWRTDAGMGFGGHGEDESDSGTAWTMASDIPSEPDIVVLCDGGMGFRDGQALQPSKSALENARWIVLKTAAPLAEGQLWERLTEQPYRDKLVVIVESSSLRQGPVQISTGFSWDATIESVFDAVLYKGDLQALSQCRHLLVTFGTEGALWLEIGKTPAATRAHIVYDAEVIEGERKGAGCGTAFGSLSCVTAAVAWFLARGGDNPDLEKALEGGLSALQNLHSQGHGPAAKLGAGYPAARLAKQIKTSSVRFSRTVLPLPPPRRVSKAQGANAKCWSIIHQALDKQGSADPEPAWELAEHVALSGPIALGSLPHLAIGKLMSADRQEIESLRVLRRLITEYRDRGPCKKPLSFGVFGPPGAGKSFAVREIAEALLAKEGWMEFNLSQFKEGADDLIGAFHQIRDRALKGHLPVAFFDEFDSRSYAWLQYLLAPMQDGAFQEGQITHPIGKCILIFAGGTSKTFNSFGPPEEDDEAYSRFRMAKGPDFKSRLDGFLDVLGPNRRVLVTKKKGKSGGVRWTDSTDSQDIFYPVRRAFMIRAELGCKSDEKLAIDPGLLKGLLQVKNYEHGARSISKVVEPLRAARPGAIHLSRLGPRQQLALHVDATDFLTLCRTVSSAQAAKGSWDSANRESVAEAIHETYRRMGAEEGWLKTENDIDYQHIVEFYKRSNRAAADRMQDTLALVGLTLEPGSNTVDEREQVRLDIEHNLELLADAEHEGWMAWHLNQGWEYGPKKPDTNLSLEPKAEEKTHPCLKPYTTLSAVDRNKDRDSIRHYLDFAKAAEMKIVRQPRP